MPKSGQQQKNGVPPAAPRISGEVLRNKEKEGGALAGLLAKLGLGGSGAASGVSAAGGGLLATKTGILAVVVAGSSVAAGIGYLATQGSDSSGGPSRAAKLFSAAAKNAGSETMAGTREALEASRRARNTVSADGVSNSLDYFNTANKGAVGEEAAAEGEGEGDEVADAAASADSGRAPSVDLGGGATGNSSKAGASKPKMVKSKGFKGRSGGRSKLRLTAQKGLAGGIGGGFEKTYKRPSKGMSAGAKGSRSRQGARRRSSVMRGGAASRQAVNTHKVTRSSLRGPNLSSANSGRTYDGGRGTLGAAGAGGGSIGGAGAGAGGAGVSDGKPNASTVENLREVPEPASVKKTDSSNKTKYQNLMYAAVGALAIAGILLFFAQREATASKVAGITPVDKLAHASAAKTLAGFATALAAIATGIGIFLALQEGQMLQGGMLAMAGAILTFSAGKIFLDDTSADQANAQINSDIKGDMTGDAYAKLGNYNGTSGNIAGYQNGTVDLTGAYPNAGTGTAAPTPNAIHLGDKAVTMNPSPPGN